jgi:hypothetical protein
MSFTTSSLTLAGLKEQVQSDYGVGTVTDARVLSGVNRFLSKYQRLERQAYPDRGLKVTSAVTIPSTGYALSSITDLGNEEEGFRLYAGEVKPEKMIPKRNQGNDDGWYISDSKIYLNKDYGDVYIEYYEKTTKYPASTTTTTVLPIDRDAEEAAALYVVGAFYRYRQEFDLATDSEERAYDELTRLFRKPPKAIAL